MTIRESIDALWMWLLLSGTKGCLEEPAADYGGMLEQMEAAELLAAGEGVVHLIPAASGGHSA